MKNESNITNAAHLVHLKSNFLPTNLLQVQMTTFLLRTGADSREDILLEMEDLQF